MFGYVIPCREKLTEEQWQTYRAAYCGLCHTMSRRYGFLARFLLNYDFTFLALLLRREENAPCTKCRRCVSRPLKGRDAREQDAALELAADACVLLACWKAKDSLRDERGLRRLAALGELMLFFPVFRRGRRQNPELNLLVSRQLHRLHLLEQQRCPSIDQVSDSFAEILAALVPPDCPEQHRRILREILYHMGRWIYLVDAWDDLSDDLKRRRYNPIALRFGLEQAEDRETVRAEASQQVLRTLRHSENLAISAFHIGDFGYHAPIVENVLCAGLNVVGTLVFSGAWKKARKHKKQELNQL